MATIKVTGIEEIDRKIAELKKSTVKRVMRKAFKAVAEPIAETARQLTPAGEKGEEKQAIRTDFDPGRMEFLPTLRFRPAVLPPDDPGPMQRRRRSVVGGHGGLRPVPARRQRRYALGPTLRRNVVLPANATCRRGR